MCCEAAGSRGTIGERGQERQRKLDGLREWKFDTVLQMFPQLLQLALLFFAVALSIFLWTVHLAIAIIVLALTCIGFSAYILFLVSAIMSPDSPFQTPLAAFLIYAIPFAAIKRQANVVRHLYAYLRSSLSRAFDFLLPVAVPDSRDLAMQTKNSSGIDPYDHLYFAPESSEVQAVLWVLETTTDPVVVDQAAAMAVDLQWPLDTDLTLPMNRLADTCFFYTSEGTDLVLRLREELADCAIHCGKAYGSLRLASRASRLLDGRRGQQEEAYSRPKFGGLVAMDGQDLSQFAQVLHVSRILDESPELLDARVSISGMEWALQVIPSLRPDLPVEKKIEYFLDQFQTNGIETLDVWSLPNYLCCLNSFLSPVSPRLMVQTNKSPFQHALTLQLFNMLAVIMNDTNTPLVAKIVKLTAQLAINYVEDNRYIIRSRSIDPARLIAALCRFCHLFPRQADWVDVVSSAAVLASIHNADSLERFLTGGSFDTAQLLVVDWIWVALDHIQQAWEEESIEYNKAHWDSDTVRRIRGLLQVWACAGALLQKPSSRVIDIIIRALRSDGDIAHAALAILDVNQSWLFDPGLQPVLQRSAVWGLVGRVVLNHPQATHRYAKLAMEISTTPEWKPFVFTGICLPGLLHSHDLSGVIILSFCRSSFPSCITYGSRTSTKAIGSVATRNEVGHWRWQHCQTSGRVCDLPPPKSSMRSSPWRTVQYRHLSSPIIRRTILMRWANLSLTKLSAQLRERCMHLSLALLSVKQQQPRERRLQY
ncbi:hypothetical protein DFH06DRAFT_438905 [Mycena polygramma]|nr:hypothetical protein DFH06DRAFT_438905 [Mycena polygramma]